MSDINDILLDGEEVLWEGAPDPALTKPLAPYWRRKATHIAIIISVAGLVAASIWAAKIFSSIGLVFNTIAVIGIAGLIPGVIVFFDFKDSREDPSKHKYVLTTRRLIAFLDDANEKKQVFASSAIAIITYKKEQPHRLCVFYGQSDDEFLSLVGLSDIDQVEQLVTKTLAPRSSMS